MSLLLGDQLNKYRTLFNPFYFGITSTVQNIIRDYNISNPIIGGEITKLSIDNNIIKADIVYNKEHDGIILQVLNTTQKPFPPFLEVLRASKKSNKCNFITLR